MEDLSKRVLDGPTLGAALLIGQMILYAAKSHLYKAHLKPAVQFAEAGRVFSRDGSTKILRNIRRACTLPSPLDSAALIYTSTTLGRYKTSQNP